MARIGWSRQHQSPIAWAVLASARAGGGGHGGQRPRPRPRTRNLPAIWKGRPTKSTAWLETDKSLEPEFSPASQPLEQRLRLLRQLASSLECARAAVLGSDLVELTLQTARQRELCAALRQVEGEASVAPRERWNRLRQESAQMEKRVSHLNREYGALLARARRTVDIFCRVLANSEITYLPPKRESTTCRSGVGG